MTNKRSIFVNDCFITPKYRIAKCNRLRWKYNKHKKPFYFALEIYKEIRRSDEPLVIKLLFKDIVMTNRYTM